MWDDLLVADHLQDIAHGLRKLAERDHTLVIPQTEVKSDTFCHVIGEPPTRVAGLVRRTGDGSMQPIAIKLEELPRLGPQIWKFFFKCDHDFRSGHRVIPRQRHAIELALFPAETIPAEAHSVLSTDRGYEWHPQIDQRPQIAGAPTRNADTPLHQSCAIFRALCLQSSWKELPVRWFQVRAQSCLPSPPA